MDEIRYYGQMARPISIQSSDARYFVAVKDPTHGAQPLNAGVWVVDTYADDGAYVGRVCDMYGCPTMFGGEDAASAHARGRGLMPHPR